MIRILGGGCKSAVATKGVGAGLYFAKIHDEKFSLCEPKGFKSFCFTVQFVVDVFCL